MRATRDTIQDVYAAHAPSCARLAYVLTGDRDLAFDLAQRAFVKLAGRFADIRDPFAFEAHLRATVVDLVRRHHRRLTVERGPARSGESGRFVRPPLESGGDRLWLALRSLPPRQRAALVLRHYEDLSEQQTAAVLDCSPAAVRSLVARGTAALGQPVAGGGELEARLRELMELKAEEMGARGGTPTRLRMKVRWRRAGWVASAGAAVLTLSLLGVAVGRTPLITLRAGDISEDRVSKAEFIESADTICAPINERISAKVIGAPASHFRTGWDLREAAAALHDYALLVDTELGQLSTLQTVPEAARIWNRILSGSRLAMSYVGQAQRAAEHGHAAAFRRAMRASVGPRTRANRLASEYGFEHCVIR